MSIKLCCVSCFNDSYLRSSDLFIRDSNLSDCEYCGTKGIARIEPSKLGHLFSIVIDSYGIDENGQSLMQLLKEDWDLFPNMDDARVRELLTEILDDGEIVRKSFRRVKLDEPPPIENWTELRAELMHRNRWFLHNAIDHVRLEKTLLQVIVDSTRLTQAWYRARIHDRPAPFTAEDMIAPPNHLVGPGRANPPGIAYLYLASTPNTAIAEVRPQPGDIVYVANFQLPQFRFADLRDPRNAVSP